jgi:hypothetical protein
MPILPEEVPDCPPLRRALGLLRATDPDSPLIYELAWVIQGGLAELAEAIIQDRYVQVTFDFEAGACKQVFAKETRVRRLRRPRPVPY